MEVSRKVPGEMRNKGESTTQLQKLINIQFDVHCLSKERLLSLFFLRVNIRSIAALGFSLV